MSDAADQAPGVPPDDARPLRLPRVLAITRAYDPYVGGGYEMGTIETVEELRARGFEIHILCARGQRYPTDDPRLRPDMQPDNDVGDVWVHYRGLSTAENYRRHVFCPENHAATARAIREVQPDVVLYFNLGLVSLSPLVAVREAGLPAVGQISDSWPLNIWLEEWRETGRKRVRRRLIEARWRAVVARAEFGQMWLPSDSMITRFAERGFDAGETRLQPLPLPRGAAETGARVAPRDRAAGDPLRLVCTSMWWGGKGQHILVDAVRIAAERGVDVELDLFGTGDDEYVDWVRGKIAAPALEGRVRVHGRQPRERLFQVLCESHVFAFPSLWPEPFGLATIEGMVHGLAVLGSDAGATPEIARHEREGLIVPAGDYEALAAAIERLAGDEPLRRRLADAGHRRALEDYSGTRYYDTLAAELIARGAATAGSELARG